MDLKEKQANPLAQDPAPQAAPPPATESLNQVSRLLAASRATIDRVLSSNSEETLRSLRQSGGQ